jgi:hypothetical protein
MQTRLSRMPPMGRGSPLLLVGFAMLTALYIAQIIANGDTKSFAILAAFGTLCVLASAIMKDWRFGIPILFVWLALEDLLRKYVGNSLVIYAVKDVLFLIILTSYFLEGWKRREEPFKNPVRVPLLLWFGWAIADSFNSQITNFAVPVLGLRMSFLYIPLIYLGYHFFRDEARLKKFSLYMLEVGAVVSVLGIIQSVIGLNFLNPIADDPYLRLRLIRYVPGTHEEILRPTGTFVDAGRFAQYLFVVAFIGLGLLAYLYATQGTKGRKLILLPLTCWMLVLAGIFVSAQRSIIALLAIAFLALIPAYIFSKQGRVRVHNLRPIIRAVLAGTLAMVVLYAWFPDRFSNVFRFYDLTINPQSQYAEVGTRGTGYWNTITYSYEQSGLIGHGTGSASLGLQYLYKAVTESAYAAIAHTEGGYAGVLWEWGAIGLVLWLWWTCILVLAMFRKMIVLRGTPYYWLGVSILLFSICFLFPLFYLGFQTYQNYVSQAFFYFLIGLFFRLPALAEKDSKLIAITSRRPAEA